MSLPNLLYFEDTFGLSLKANMLLTSSLWSQLSSPDASLVSLDIFYFILGGDHLDFFFIKTAVC